MKHSLTLNSALLATTMLFAPLAAATAQETAPVSDETIVVQGAFIPEPQRETSQVASFLSEEDLSRQGDFDAASALTRLSGVSVVGGRFPFVRGLGDRYSVAILNGSPLPSTEPLRRAIPLDLFPSNVLSGISVQKTFSADYPGEFGGGVINMTTLRRPAEPFAAVKFGISGNTETTAGNGLFVNGGDLDWLGYDDGTRDLPGGLENALNSNTPLREFSDAQIESFGEGLTNSPLRVIQSGELGPNFEFSAEGGTSFDKGDAQIGLVGVIGYKSEWETQRAIRQLVAGTDIGEDQVSTETTLKTIVNALGSASVGWGDQEVAATLFYVHSSAKEAQIDEGFNFNLPGDGFFLNESSTFIERELIYGQLTGDHGLGNDDFWDSSFILKWRAAASRSTRDSPYEWRFGRILDDDGTPEYSLAPNNDLNFSTLEDNLYSAGADLLWEFDMGPNVRRGEISVGGSFSNLEREYRFNALEYAGGNSLPENVQRARVDFLFSPDNIEPNRFFLREITSTEDNYNAALDIYAAYGQLDIEPIEFVRLTAGVRYETAEQSVQTFSRLDPRERDGAAADLDNDYVLPSVALTWNPINDLQLRVSYTETISRPQFRELARSQYFDPDTERQFLGNEFLVDSELTNYDARVEYYFGTNQFITLAGFYKDIEKPIEEVQFSTSDFAYTTSYINSPAAEVYGGEFELRLNFDTPEFLSNEWMDDRTWLFTVNYTYTNATVVAEEGDTVIDVILGEVDASQFNLDGVQLQGTPEHIANVQFGWESDYDQLTVILGWVDERILQRGLLFGSQTLPDVIEDPGVQLDVVFRRTFELNNHQLVLGVSGRNLLNEAHEEFQESQAFGRTEFNTYERGRSFSASITAQF